MYWIGVCARSIFPIERVFFALERNRQMVRKKSTEPSPESVARVNRKRTAVEDGLQAMAHFEREAVAVRKNMDRLRALREAREAEAAAHEPAAGSAPTKAKRKARVPA